MALAFSVALFVGCSRKGEPQSREDVASWQSMAVNGNAMSQPGDEAADSLFTEIRPAGAIGSQACVDCHNEEHASYFATSHGRSMRRISTGTANEPGALFEDAKSRRVYEVEVGPGSMIHREQVRGASDERLAVNQAAMKFEVGSGAHAHSYLFERDGFLVQSPLTWYESVKKWELSPGYDPTKQATFDRTVTTTCAFCHVGSIRTQGNAIERFAIVELKIGCERCHGVGGNHIQFHSGEALPTQGNLVDDIVNPSRLSRALGEAVCSQCHLQGAASCLAPNSNRWDFRPGQPLSDTVTEFQIYGGESAFRIVGHTEQIHASVCYQQTDTLTCTTCHNPHSHGSKPLGQAVSTSVKQRNHCIACHKEDSCKVPHDIRMKTQQDDCTRCHMPRRDTNVPHAALHDHRIGVHAKSYLLANLSVPEPAREREKPSPDPPRLVAINDDLELPEWQRRRRWSLALHSLAFGDQLPIQMRSDFAKAQKNLVELFRDGRSDPNLLVSLAKDYLDANQPHVAKDLAQQAIGKTTQGEVGYIGAADVLAQFGLRDQDNQEALKWFRELVRYRRVSGDHVMLAICENNAGNRDAAIKSLELALRIDPTMRLAHDLMATFLDADGDTSRADAHRDVIHSIRASGSLLPQ